VLAQAALGGDKVIDERKARNHLHTTLNAICMWQQCSCVRNYGMGCSARLSRVPVLWQTSNSLLLSQSAASSRLPTTQSLTLNLTLAQTLTLTFTQL
jgi:hypothetical protein